MKAVTVGEFRDRASQWLKSKEPILILRRGQLVGIPDEIIQPPFFFGFLA